MQRCFLTNVQTSPKTGVVDGMRGNRHRTGELFRYIAATFSAQLSLARRQDVMLMRVDFLVKLWIGYNHQQAVNNAREREQGASAFSHGVFGSSVSTSGRRVGSTKE